MTTTSSISPQGGAAGLILLWVRLYTAGLAQSSRERRLDQIRSDLWEHYSDRTAEGAVPALIGLEALGRAARGVVADLFWRFQLEGPQVRINIPIERIAGAALLLLIGAFFLSSNASGYDPGVDGFEGELRRLAGIKGWQVGIYTALQVLAGIGMLACSVILYLTLRRHSTTPVILAAVAMASAGLLTLVNSALYATAAELADEFVAATPDHAEVVLTVARSFVLMLTWMVPVTVLMLAISIAGFSFITAGHGLVPLWLRLVGGGGAVAITLSLVSEAVTDSDLSWFFIIVGFLLMLLWLLVAGGWLLLGGAKEADPRQVPPAADQTDHTIPSPVS